MKDASHYLDTTTIDTIIADNTPTIMSKKRKYFSLLIYGREGTGKTLTALATAIRLTRDPSKVLFIETDGNPDNPYGFNDANNTGFPCPSLHFSRFQPAVWMGMFEIARRGGYKALVVDSITPFWNGPNGLLDVHDRISGGNPKYSGLAWQEVNKIQEAMFAQIIAARSEFHVILCARATNERQNGELSGIRPEWRENLGYSMNVIGKMYRRRRSMTTIAVEADALGNLKDMNAQTAPTAKADPGRKQLIEEAITADKHVDIVLEIEKTCLAVPRITDDHRITLEKPFEEGQEFINPSAEIAIADAVEPFLYSGAEIQSERERADAIRKELPQVRDRQALLGLYRSVEQNFYDRAVRSELLNDIKTHGKNMTRDSGPSPIQESKPLASADVE